MTKRITRPAARSPHRRWCMWGRRSHTGRFYGGDLLSIWREGASEVTGGPLDTGHYLAEEAPQAVIEAFERHFV